jgi:hypothetical protein
VDELEECKRKVETLEEENQHLRNAAGAFGALAERLNGQLREERRSRGGDRRAHARETPDRRTSR